LASGRPKADDARIDAQTGKLRLLKYDSDGNGKVDTVSYMDGSRVVKIEIDKDEDGKVDRWSETYDGERLSSVAFDTRHRGVPNRRLIYAADGNARVEVDVKGDGHFVLVSGAAAAPPK
jgi:hypothetical protein